VSGIAEDPIQAREILGLTWPTIHQLLRLGTNATFPGAMSDAEAIRWVADWIDAGVEIVSDTDTTWSLFDELVSASDRALRKAIDDAHLAAVAISRGATLASFDADFATFVGHGLRWEDLRER
jgi:predicted nucleic acid-binding protein